MKDLFTASFEKIKELDAQREKISKEILETYKTMPSELPLDVKWDIFCFVAPYLPEKGYVYTDSKDILHDFVGYDCPVHAERMQSVSFVEIIETLEECVEEYMEYISNPGDYFVRSVLKTLDKLRERGSDLLGIEEELEYNSKAREAFEAAINEIKLEYIESGYCGFSYDW